MLQKSSYPTLITTLTHFENKQQRFLFFCSKPISILVDKLFKKGLSEVYSQGIKLMYIYRNEKRKVESGLTQFNQIKNEYISVSSLFMNQEINVNLIPMKGVRK